MTPLLAGHHLWNVRRAWAGARYCRGRLEAIEAAAPRIKLDNGLEMIDHRGQPTHDVDYYAWEAVRIVNIAKKVAAAGLRRKDEVEDAMAQLRAEAPQLESFRNAVTHVEDNRNADDVAYSGAAVRLKPGGDVEHVLDPRDHAHDALGAVVAAIEVSLLTIAAPDDGPLPRFVPA